MSKAQTLDLPHQAFGIANKTIKMHKTWTQAFFGVLARDLVCKNQSKPVIYFIKNLYTLNNEVQVGQALYMLILASNESRG